MTKEDSRLTKDLERLTKRIEASKKRLHEAKTKADNLEAAIDPKRRVFIFRHNQNRNKP